MSEIDISKCEYKTANGCSATLSGSCVKDNCQTYRLFKQLQQYKQLCEQKTVDNFELIKENEELKEKLNTYENLTEIQRRDFNEIFERCAMFKHCFDEIFENIEYIEATAERIDDDNYIALACRIAETSRNILQLIKQAKEGEE